MAVMRSVHTPARRRTAIGASVFVVLLIVFTIVARWNPWNLVLLDRVEQWTTPALLFLAPLVAAAFVLLYVPNRALAITGGVLCAVLALSLLCCSGFAELLSEPGKRTLVGISDDGRYHLVVDKSGGGLGDQQVVKVVRPAGRNTRESARPLLCVRSQFNDPPPMQYKFATFSGAHEVELTLTDGSTHRIGFHPDTVEPERTLTVWCHRTDGHVKVLA
jgi:hypothetical protein